MTAVENLFNELSGIIWGPLMLVLLLGTGFYLTAGGRLISLRQLVHPNRPLSPGRAGHPPAGQDGGGGHPFPGPKGSRTLPVTKFFLDTLTTALAPDELLTEIRIPLPPAKSGGAYFKIERKVGDFATAAAALGAHAAARPPTPWLSVMGPASGARGGGGPHHRRATARPRVPLIVTLPVALASSRAESPCRKRRLAMPAGNCLPRPMSASSS